MSTQNDITIESYEQNVQDYIEHTESVPSDSLKDWYQGMLESVAKDAHILEIGSASGRDARYIESLGYRVQCTDATQGFVDVMRRQGIDAIRLNVLTDAIPPNLDVVIANAVFVHFNREDTENAARNIYDALSPGGTFYLSVIKGAGEVTTDASDRKMSSPRYFYYWSEDDMRTVLEEAGFHSIEIVPAKLDRWLMITAKR